MDVSAAKIFCNHFAVINEYFCKNIALLFVVVVIAAVAKQQHLLDTINVVGGLMSFSRLLCFLI